MEDPSRMTTLHDLHLASRKAEEGACRRFEAAGWLETLVGPLGLPNQPSEQEFLSCLRNGIFLCNAINKISPGAVPKVVEGHPNLLSFETQPLPAYQYFENVRNFLVAAEELKLPAFEASVLERDTLEVGSSSKVVDCILALKSYHERKELGANGFYKHSRSPMVSHSASRIHSRTSATGSSDHCRRLDMSFPSENQPNVETERHRREVSLVGVLAQCLVDTKENVDQNLLASVCSGNQNSLKLFTKIMSSFLQEQHENKFPELKKILKDSSKEVNGLNMDSPDSIENASRIGNYKCCKSCLKKKGNCNHWRMLEVQEKDLLELKSLLASTKKEFELLQSQLQNDLKQIGNQVQELSTAALGYHWVVKENRKLYNMVQDLKGNIRVYCRIRPTFNAESKGVVDFIGEDGSLVIVDPAKPQRDPEKAFHFNRVYGLAATQEEVFKDVKPLIRSVMDGYNVCIFAYGQTGSGKTHTMCGPSGGSMKDRGINYHALNDLFHISCKRNDIMDYEVHVQMVEIYNEQVRDLLVEDSSITKLEIRTCTSNGGLSLPGATMYPVKSTGDVLNLMKLGELNRVVSSTALNNQSSRSHSILTVHVQGRDKSGSILRSCLHLVDLAGSERVDKSEVTGDRLKEAQHINKSLSCLGDVITALAQKNPHIPYRNSKLTQLLQYSLGGRAKTLMFAHVSPEADSYGETISTLKFAQRVSTVELGVARMNKESSEVRELREQVESLKKALARKEAQEIQFDKAKELRSPCEKPKVTERTPPRYRRLSTESSSIAKAEKVVNQENRKGSKTPIVKAKLRTERTPTRSQVLNLEGLKYDKDQMQARNSKDVQVTKRGVQQYVAPCLLRDGWNNGCSYLGQCQNPESITSSGKCADGSSMTVAYHNDISRSPNNSVCQSQTLATDCRMRIPRLQLPKTPEPQIRARNEVQIVPQRDLGLSNKSHIPSLVSSTSKKGSQIKKSLQNIGKLIHGSEKRNLLHTMETQSPIHGMSNITDGKSPPLISSARAMRRQSLTGGQTLGMEKSRRSSLGGKSAGCHSNETRNARTPPPVQSPTCMAKRWL